MIKRLSLFARISAVAIVLDGPVALSADYPFSGYFGIQLSGWGSNFDRAQEKCALSFWIQNKDGSSATYYLNQDEFLINKTISYTKVMDQNCKIDVSNKIETCEGVVYDGNGETKFTGYTVFETISPTKLSYRYFGDKPELDRFLANRNKNGYVPPVEEDSYRCIDFSNDVMEKHLSDMRNLAPPEKTSELMSPQFREDNGNQEIAKRVLLQIKSEQ